MTDGGDTKDDVKLPENEIGDKIKKMFQEEEKDVSKYSPYLRRSSHSRTNTKSDVVILTAMGEEAAVEAKEAAKSG